MVVAVVVVVVVVVLVQGYGRWALGVVCLIMCCFKDCYCFFPVWMVPIAVGRGSPVFDVGTYSRY